MKKALSSFIFAILLIGCVGGVSTSDDPKRPDLALNCSAGMSEYTVLDTSLGFCYDPVWGEVGVKDTVGVTGRLVEVTFADDGPVVYYESADFEPVEGGEKMADFESLIFTLNEERITENLVRYFDVSADSIVVKKSDVSGIRAARVEMDGKLEYYVPNTYDGFNLLISWDADKAEEVDEFVFDVIL
ncbi:MAG: hypothetical protein GWP15_00590 [Nitrospirae bacterium]|nr:hypothetical protein [Nitrospirota bacterium]